MEKELSLDIINGLFEFGGAIALSRNVWITYKAKEVKGISIISTIWFSLWGYFNCCFYPSLGQHWSFIAGVLVATINTIWVGQMIWYKKSINHRKN